ncbi:MAG: hypothetical protein M0R00_08520 [Candidatus Omnitrophica bacterium]|jgi:hypothetical protein|nr:hypothetical protein [Candidatus Omnitrophota bacterium]
MIANYEKTVAGHEHVFNLCEVCSKTRILPIGYGKLVCDIAPQGTSEYVHTKTHEDPEWVCSELKRIPLKVYVKCPKCQHLQHVKDIYTFPVIISCEGCKKVFDSPFNKNKEGV